MRQDMAAGPATTCRVLHCPGVAGHATPAGHASRGATAEALPGPPIDRSYDDRNLLGDQHGRLPWTANHAEVITKRAHFPQEVYYNLVTIS